MIRSNSYVIINFLLYGMQLCIDILGIEGNRYGYGYDRQGL